MTPASPEPRTTPSLRTWVRMTRPAFLLLTVVGCALGTATVSDVTPTPWSWELSSGENKAYPQRDGLCYLLAGSGLLAAASVVAHRLVHLCCVRDSVV